MSSLGDAGLFRLLFIWIPLGLATPQAEGTYRVHARPGAPLGLEISHFGGWSICVKRRKSFISYGGVGGAPALELARTDREGGKVECSLSPSLGSSHSTFHRPPRCKNGS